MNRFFVSKDSFHGNKVMLSKDQAHQIRDVLRLRPEDQIFVLDNTGWEYKVSLAKVTHEQVVGEILQKLKAPGEPQTQITLYQSLLARDKFEWVLQKCTEVGVTRFAPVITQRTLIRETAIKPEKIDRWQRIITEAAEQSHRGLIPDLSLPVTFEKILPDLRGFERCLIACEPAESGFDPAQRLTLRQALRSDRQTAPGTVAILVGPEGGFTEQEVVAAKESGAIPITLGPRILRTETAAIVAATLILYELSQMEG
jgi:16S rRNA (uracil1498-N3)-methyltransferase